MQAFNNAVHVRVIVQGDPKSWTEQEDTDAHVHLVQDRDVVERLGP